ncbi:unnamed protein product [Lathyrus sativus]|nr:unnamed protein product [Lathyrus sativus]
MATAEEINYDSLPNLPIDLVGEIFCRLPVKLLLQLRCMCKSWNSLISDRNFTRKHLSLSTTRRLHYACYNYEPHELIHNSYPLESVLTNIPTKFKGRRNLFNRIYNSIVGSCDGLLCLADRSKGLVILWNPCFKKFKFKESPPFENSENLIKVYAAFGFGYDHVSENYKVVVLYYPKPNLFNKTKVKVHTLGTNCWKTIESFPFGTVEHPAIYIRGTGTLNWIVYTKWVRLGPCFIVSFDLGKESYQKLLPPPGHAEIGMSLSVLRDCLCVLFDNHIWVMKEYGIYDSWTKLLSVSYMQDRSKCCLLFDALYIFDDDRVLLETEEDSKTKVVVYDPKNDTFKVALFKDRLHVCLESLISPYDL